MRDIYSNTHFAHNLSIKEVFEILKCSKFVAQHKLQIVFILIILGACIKYTTKNSLEYLIYL